MSQSRVDVLVVGAGPTGLMLANWLARSGIPVAVIDAKGGPTRESRALVVQARSMEIYDQLGVVDEVLRQCVPVREVAPGFERRAFGRIPVGDLGAGLTPYPRLYVLEQSRNEQILYAHLRRKGADVLWEHALESLHSGPDGVTATVTGPGGTRTIRARYCVGADGSGSTVRRLSGIPFEGATNEHEFFVCDAVGVDGLVEGAVNIRPARTDMLLGFPMGPSGDHRVLGLLRRPVGADTAGPALEAAVRARLRRVYGVGWVQSRWFSTYRVHHRVAASFRQGAVFLAGDAAHVHSPVGAQGMNTGLQDAHNLALRLADVVAGRASDSSLDGYEADRRPVAERLVSTTDRVFGAVTSQSLPARVIRRLVIPVVGPIAVRLARGQRLPPLPFEYLGQLRIHYWMSAAARASGRRDQTVGRRLPYSGDNFGSLRAAEWQVHVYGSVDPGEVARIGAELGVPVRRFPAPRTPRLRAGTFYLVRPDGFVAAAATTSRAVDTLSRALPDRFVAAPTPTRG